MLRNLTLNSIFWLFLGVLLTIYGGYVVYRFRIYPFGAGLIFTGLGGILCGVTNGFTDYTPLGRLFWKIGIIALLLGLPVVIYYIYRSI